MKVLMFLVVTLLVTTGYCQDDVDAMKSNASTVEPPTSAATPNHTITTEPPSTSPSPTIVPATRPDVPLSVSWNVTENNTTCVLLNAGFRFHFLYSNATVKNVSGVVDLPNDTIATGKCQPEMTLNAKFLNGWQLTLVFNNGTKDGTKYWWLESVDLVYKLTKEIFPDIKVEINEDAKVDNQTLFKTGNGTCWQCKSESPISFANKSLQAIDTFSLQVQAGLNAKIWDKPAFSDDASVCPQDTIVSNIVPIAVGAALGALVLIVLIAYLVGRRRTKRGYESV